MGEGEDLAHDPERALGQETLARLPFVAIAIAIAMTCSLALSEPSGIPVPAIVLVVNAAMVLATVGIFLLARAGRIPVAMAAPAATASWIALPISTLTSLYITGDERLSVLFIMELLAAPSVILVGRWLAVGVVSSALGWAWVELVVRAGHDGLAPFVGAAVVLTGIGHVLHARAIIRADAARADIAAAGRRLVQAQRLEAVGTLASGLAHDMNNILAGILGAAEAMRSANGPDAAGLLREIVEEARRGGDLTRSLLAFSRKGQYRHEPIEIAGAVEQVVAILRRTVSKSVILDVHHARPGVVVDGDPAQLTQAIFNLALNGAQAIGEAGAVTIATGADGDGAALQATLEVRDTGAGMDEETRARIFEPFFTTKAPGHGSGLGLAMVYGTILAHKGTIDVESTPGRGTTMRIKLPARLQAPAAAPAPDVANVEAVPDPASLSSLHILLVDDEPLIRSMYERALVRAGMRVTTATHGGDALERFEQAITPIDAVVLDMSMPVVSGPECFRRLRELRPGLPIVIASGYIVDAEARALLSAGGAAFLEKPFRNEALISALRSLTTAS